MVLNIYIRKIPLPLHQLEDNRVDALGVFEFPTDRVGVEQEGPGGFQ